MRQQAERIILAAIKGHQTYAQWSHYGPSDTSWTGTDEFGQCKCLTCAIARRAGFGRDECMRQRIEASRRHVAEAAAQDREYWEQQRRNHPEWDEVPF
jgi:hypothetical protein